MSVSPLIIGIGNQFRCDDGIGLFIVEKLQKRNVDADFLLLSGEGTELMQQWQNRTRVIVVDAVSSGEEAGHIFNFDAGSEEIPTNFFNYSSHAFGLAEAVALSRALKKLPEELYIVGVEGQQFSQGTALSDKVKDAVDPALELIMERLKHEK